MIKSVRERNPLVHCITNYVAMEFNADALLAVGASPLMSFCPEEMDEIVGKADSLLVNIGCLDAVQIEAMKLAAGAACRRGLGWVLDPVGAGATALRTATALMLIRDFHPAIIRANAAEILALSGEESESKGVDSLCGSGRAEDAARRLAAQSGAVVAVSGEVDFITDGHRSEHIAGGAGIMSKVTAMGCTASALSAAFLPVAECPFDAALYAMSLMKRVGETAAARCHGTASMRVEFLDALYNFCRDE